MVANEREPSRSLAPTPVPSPPREATSPPPLRSLSPSQSCVCCHCGGIVKRHKVETNTPLCRVKPNNPQATEASASMFRDRRVTFRLFSKYSPLQRVRRAVQASLKRSPVRSKVASVARNRRGNNFSSPSLPNSNSPDCCLVGGCKGKCKIAPSAEAGKKVVVLVPGFQVIHKQSAFDEMPAHHL